MKSRLTDALLLRTADPGGAEQAHRAAFEPIAGSIFNVDAAGIHTHVYPDLPHRKRTRPVFPVEIRPERLPT